MESLAREIALEIYKQCHEHMREDHRKRDQVVAAYLVLLGLFFSNLDKLKEHETAVAVFLGILGVFAIAIVTQYKKWHLLYDGSLTIFQVLLATDGPYALAKAKKVWGEKPQPWGLLLLNPTSGVENSVFYRSHFLRHFPGTTLRLRLAKASFLLRRLRC